MFHGQGIEWVQRTRDHRVAGWYAQPNGVNARTHILRCDDEEEDEEGEVRYLTAGDIASHHVGQGSHQIWVTANRMHEQGILIPQAINYYPNSGWVRQGGYPGPRGTSSANFGANGGPAVVLTPEEFPLDSDSNPE